VAGPWCLAVELFADYLPVGVILEIARVAVSLVVIEKGSEREVVDKRKVVRLRVPEMAAFIIIEIDAATGGENVFVTEVVLINQGIGCGEVITEPGAVIQTIALRGTVKRIGGLGKVSH